MATPTSIYSPSYEKLKALYESAKSEGATTLILPERPSGPDVIPNRYLNSAISMLGESAACLHRNHHYLDTRLDEFERNIEEQVTKLDGTVHRLERKVDQNFHYVQKQFNAIDQRFDKVDQRFNQVDQRFNQVEDDIKAVKDDVKAVKDDVKAVKDDVNQRFDEAKAINFNQFATALETPIAEVAVLVQDRNGQKKYEVGAGFPDTVEEFWLLKSNSKPCELFTRLSRLTSIIVAKLTSLARHYSIKGWKKWPRLDREKPGPTQYDRLEDAVAAYPQGCLRILAATWGLNYRQMDRLETETEKPRATAQKRKVEDETESRRVKAKVGSAYETEISILSSETQEVIVRRKTTTAEPEVRVHQQTTLEEVMREYNMPGYHMNSQESAELAWETSSSAKAARHRLRAVGGLDPPVPDETRRRLRTGKLVDVQPKVSDD